MTQTKQNFFRDFVQGGLATCGAVTFTNPLEVVKIRLQLQGELAKKGLYTQHYKGAFHALRVIASTEGLLALQKGLITAYYYQIAMNGTRLAAYDQLKRGVSSTFLKDHNTFSNVVCGALGGVAGAFVGSPFFLIKTRLQSAGGLVGHQHKYKGVWSGLFSIWKEHGIKGLWSGSNAAMLRTMVGSACQLTTYDFFKKKITDTGYFQMPIINQFCASMVSGLVVAGAMNPFDVVSTRLYNQSHTNRLYTGPLDCLLKIYRTEGISGFSKGIGAHYFRIGPHTVLTLVFWEQIKFVASKYVYKEI